MAHRGDRRSRAWSRLVLAAALTLLWLLPWLPSPAAAAEAAITRLWGANRYETAASVSRDAFAPGVAVAYIADGGNFPDSLSGGPAAALRQGPMLLTPAGGLADATRAELVRLQPRSIVILGGAGAVSNAVETAVRPYTTGSVTRLGGADRYGTSALISAAHFAPGVPVAYVASGRNFPDALSAGAAAAAEGGPVLLVEPNGVPSSIAAELARLRPQRIAVVGGAAVVSDGVLSVLRRYTTGNVSRLWGQDRYATAAAVSAAAFPQAATAFLATGLNFADAVAGVPAAAVAGAPLLLASTAALPQATFAELERLDVAEVTLLGGTGALSDALLTPIRLATGDAVPLVQVGPHAFRADPFEMPAVPDDILAFNAQTLVAPYGTLDPSGAFMYQHTDGQWYDHPVGQAQYVVNMLRNYRLVPDPTYMNLALANANRLLERAVNHDGAIFFPYGFDFVLHGRGVMEAPWYSGMAQGIALSGFTRLYRTTGDPRWLDAATRTFASFKVARQPGAPWVTAVQNGFLWFELYPWYPYDHTYNGHIWAIYGLYDYWRLTGSEEARQLVLGGLTTAERYADVARVPGGVSNYCISQSCLDRAVRNPDYHLTVIGQFIQLFRYTRAERFAQLAEAFTADFPNFKAPGYTVFEPGEHTGYSFDASGVGTAVSSASLSLSSATYLQRTVPYGWLRPGNGIWFYMSAGPFSGQWIRESGAAFPAGVVDRLEYYWPRSIVVPAGEITAYQLDAFGVVTDARTATIEATSLEYTASGKANGLPAVRLSSGPLAGYWLVSGSLPEVGASAFAVPSSPGPSSMTEGEGMAPTTDEAAIPAPMPGQQENIPASGP